MGAAASMGLSTPVSLDKAKELAGDLWSDSLQEKFNAAWEEKEGVTISDMRRIVPMLFVKDDEQVDLATIKDITSAGGHNGSGAEWNDTFQELFEKHSTVASAAEGAEADADAPKTLTFENWKALLPSIFESPEESAKRLELEFKARLALRAEGNVVIAYQMYNEEFPISQNSLTAERIDEDYALYDVMPGCKIKLSTIDSKRRTQYEVDHDGRQAPWVKEEPEGVFQELLAGETYYLICIEDPVQYAKDMQELNEKLEKMDKNTEAPKRTQEGCSCLYGNPCQDPYVCLDWDNRWQVSLANGLSKEEIKRAGFAG
eukprot:GSChrysophyteH1.ASY1.ANO1.2643.1 assembled CDS